MSRFEYRGFHGCPSVCDLDIRSLANGKTLVICTEVPDNRGTSVTNFAEELATLVCKQFGIVPDSLVWVEHYPRGVAHGRLPDWDLVTFTLAGDGTNFHFESPQWRPMRDEDWKQLGLEAPAT